MSYFQAPATGSPGRPKNDVLQPPDRHGPVRVSSTGACGAGPSTTRRWPGRARTTRAMAGIVEEVGALLHEAAETHHQVFRITDGADEDWASWYADWLIKLSE